MSAASVTMQVLHLEDSENDAELIARVLRREWPDCAIRLVSNAQHYLEALTSRCYDIILSDYSMPGYDGLSALEEARQRCPETPFLFLSGMIGEERAVEALKRGATDYIIKDRPARLVPAIRQALAFVSEANRRRQAESRLREQASLLDRARDAIYVADLDQRITYWNVSAERVYGVRASDVYGRTLSEVGLGFEAGRLSEAREATLSRGEWRGEFRIQTKSGLPVLVESTWSLVVEGGQPRAFLVIDTDVTERKKLESQLLRTQRLESIGTLAGGVAHDLNNVFTPVLLALDLLSPKAVTPDEKHILEKTRASVTHGAALVRQLLAFARGGQADRSLIQPSAALAATELLVRQWLPPSIEVAVRTAPGSWAIQANVTQVNQALINLALNARDAMPRGGRLQIMAENATVDPALAGANPGVAPGPFLRISVSDTGTGMPPELVDRVFDPFFTTKEPGKGTGLGLSTVAGIMKAHGGFVQVESRIGAGTTFHLLFPATPARQPNGPRTQDAPNLAEAALLPAPAERGRGILLVDDDPAVRETLRVLLQRARYVVFTAADAASALREYETRRDQVSLLVTDMMLPDRSGVEVVRELRRQTPELPVIAISGMMGSGIFDELSRLRPPVECLSKPLPPRVLIGAIERALQVGPALA